MAGVIPSTVDWFRMLWSGTITNYGLGQELDLQHQERLKFKIISSLETFHISCAYKCLETAMSLDDFLGVCVFNEDGKMIMEDNGFRVRSGYIFVARQSELATIGDTKHRKLYNKLFIEIEKSKGAALIGFAQQDRKLKGVAGTFNKLYPTSLLNSSRDCSFIFRTLIFGAIIMYKLSGKQNISKYSACLCISLFLIIKNEGNIEQLDHYAHNGLNLLDLQYREKFLASDTFTAVTRGVRVQYAMEQINGIRADLSEEEFAQIIINIPGR